MVEGVEEVGSELQAHPLGEQEILLQADVEVLVGGSDHRALGRAVAEGSSRWRGEGAWVKPQQPRAADGLRIVDWTIAVRAGRWRSSSGVVGPVECQREARVQGNDRADRPIPGNCVGYSWHVVTKALAPAKGNFVYGIGAENVLGVPIALSVVGIGIVQVLPVIGGWRGLGGGSPGSVVTIVVGHTLLEGVGDL